INCFERILFDYYLGNRAKKEKIRREIKQEYKNQILLYSQKLECSLVNIDSHQHYHAIAFISDILIELNSELDINISYVRVPKEPFFIEISSLKDLKNYFGLNIIKHFLLNFLSKQLIKKLKKNNIDYNEIFIGVLFTGNMTFGSIKKALFGYTLDKDIEILLHPAYLSNEEKLAWKNDKFKKFYIDENRKNEMDILLSNDFKNLIKNLKKAINE
ncbi:MAG: ChbG/HpnK family deacetylase, partial [Epsilonproteobacteria bacterium]|nr:ChbG/HpnK family deacetylase [Campylobacterota bacterium]